MIWWKISSKIIKVNIWYRLTLNCRLKYSLIFCSDESIYNYTFSRPYLKSRNYFGLLNYLHFSPFFIRRNVNSTIAVINCVTLYPLIKGSGICSLGENICYYCFVLKINLNPLINIIFYRWPTPIPACFAFNLAVVGSCWSFQWEEAAICESRIFPFSIPKGSDYLQISLKNNILSLH